MTLKNVLLLATSCKNGGLCPGGVDLENPHQWIRLVADDGNSGPVQGCDIDFAQPLDVIEFFGKPCPMLKQKENWVILNHSCKKLGTIKPDLLPLVYEHYGYHGFWGNNLAYLTVEEMEKLNDPTETIIEVIDLQVYRNNNNKVKADFNWDQSVNRILNISVTDPDFYKNSSPSCSFQKAYLVISIPKDCDWPDCTSPFRKAYKFISKIFPIIV